MRQSKKLTYAKRKSLIKNLAWDYFCLYIRIRDKWTCVVCGKSYAFGYVMQAGHVIPRGKHIVTYDERNVHCQCAICNQNHKYYPQTYYNWFIKKYGEDLFLNISEPSYLNQIYKIDYFDTMNYYREILMTKLSCNELAEFEQEKLFKLEKEFDKLNKV